MGEKLKEAGQKFEKFWYTSFLNDLFIQTKIQLPFLWFHLFDQECVIVEGRHVFSAFRQPHLPWCRTGFQLQNLASWFVHQIPLVAKIRTFYTITLSANINQGRYQITRYVFNRELALQFYLLLCRHHFCHFENF